ncbi:10551_t:CDS:1 [Paraglomus brasilianum]|uniref:10551_t:CDS:1 n=1 Tax=Paraglomus brasilianum TaxID=144538 RepID=A0A9N9AS89_9GLOM|nr:10551_t:CDS:1 [Paraglomus brasilianum]
MHQEIPDLDANSSYYYYSGLDFLSQEYSEENFRLITYKSHLPPIDLVRQDANYSYCSGLDILLRSQEFSEENFRLITRPPYKSHLLPIELVHQGTRLSKSRSRKEGQPPRPQNGFIIFKKDFDARRRSVPSDTKVDSKVMSKLAAFIWHSDEGLRKYFNLLAKLALQIHKELYPDYDYKPKKCVVVKGSQQAKPLRIRQYTGPYDKGAKRKGKNAVRNQESGGTVYQEFRVEDTYEDQYNFLNAMGLSMDILRLLPVT